MTSAVKTGGTATGVVRVALLHRPSVLAEGLAQSLRHDGIHVDQFQLGSMAGVVASNGLAADVVLLVADPDEAPEATDAVTTILARAGKRVLVVDNPDEVAMGRCLAAGAVGATDHSLSLAGLLEQIHRVARGEVMMSGTRRSMLVGAYLAAARPEGGSDHGLALLTRREGDVLTAIMAGRSAAQIAETMRISITTVRSHIANILGKLGVQSQLQAVSVARASGWGIADDSPASAMRNSIASDIAKPRLRLAR